MTKVGDLNLPASDVLENYILNHENEVFYTKELFLILEEREVDITKSGARHNADRITKENKEIDSMKLSDKKIWGHENAIQEVKERLYD